MKNLFFVASVTLLVSNNLQAETVGLFVGGELWKSQSSGVFGETNTPFNFDSREEQRFSYFIAAEHPFPVIPNVRFSIVSLDTSTRASLMRDSTFGGEAFSMEDDINTRFDVNYFDYTFYYKLFDNDLLSLDLGLVARDYNGNVNVSDSTSSIDDSCNDRNPSPESPCSNKETQNNRTGRVETSGVEPMLYAATDISLPLTDLNLFAESSLSLSREHSIYDYAIGLNYKLTGSNIGKLNLTLGYQVVKIKFVDFDSLYADLEFRGGFIGAIAHF